MPHHFAFSVDPVLNIVRVTMGGFFEPAAVEEFRIAREQAHRQLTCTPHQHLTLADIRDMQIQSQDAVAAFARLLNDPSYTSRRFAIVTAQSLARMQVQRAAATRHIAYFADDVAAAERWLLAGETLPHGGTLAA